MSYKLITDSASDLDQILADEISVDVIPMDFTLGNDAYKHFPDSREISLPDFYKRLKLGEEAHTTQINIERYMQFFSTYFEKGEDLLYICFTSGLSGSYNSALIAAEEVKEKYPDRKIEIVDCACASFGQGNLVFHIGKYIKENSPTLDEARKYAEELKFKVAHWFIVEDFEQLKRGGRISAVTATFGKALNIKPLLSVDNDGKLVTVAKIRGSLKTYDAIIDRLVEYGENIKEQTLFIGHTASPDKAEKLRRMVAPLCKDIRVCEIGPIIGTHVGIGMFGLTFLGKRTIK